ncbi:trypsin-like peptidase [Micromonospora pisi]|uniref:Trypsin-like peptidase n=1 Tax=Micromonospora pisi TaxID=589240 RepID=A0A495JQQ0_9ACTN|nr:S1C family serine protease [Micromonospora pisi]RKR90965.1 trypsin-like peptidase [Micromonospora pisi]
MTSGYDPQPATGYEPVPDASVPGPRQPAAEVSGPAPGAGGQWHSAPGSSEVEHTGGARPGPLPPRMEPPRGGPGAPLAAPASTSGSAPVPGQPAHTAAAPAHAPTAPTTGYDPTAPTAPISAYDPTAPTSGYGQAPGYGYAPAPAGGYGPPSTSGYGTPNAALGYPPPPDAAPTPVVRRRLAWPGITALLLVLALAGVVGFQAYQIDRLDGRLGDADRRLAEAQRADADRLEGVEGRAKELENRAGQAFNPEAISSAVLPSVFRVRAGQFTGTAFAVGKPATNGGTNLFTNFHVVEELWNGGGRQVFLERTDQRFPATIVKVDKANDVAQLSTDGTFTGLVAAPEAVKSGQQIVVVGAPLGLEDSVTTGVVSAFRDNEDGPGKVIQFDAPINPGNSGGPVINAAKQVVGIATAKARDAEGIGLAVPIKTACDGFKIC